MKLFFGLLLLLPRLALCEGENEELGFDTLSYYRKSTGGFGKWIPSAEAPETSSTEPDLYPSTVSRENTVYDYFSEIKNFYKSSSMNQFSFIGEKGESPYTPYNRYSNSDYGTFQTLKSLMDESSFYK